MENEFAFASHDDSAAIWMGELAGVTIWMQSVLMPEYESTNQSWALELRADRALEVVLAGPRESPLQVHSIDETTHQLRWTGDQILDGLVSDTIPLEFRLPDSGIRFGGQIRLGARFADFRGTDRLFVDSEMLPIFLGRRLFVRGTAQCQPGFAIEKVYRDDDIEPRWFWGEDQQWVLDFSPADFLLALQNPWTKTIFEVRDSDDRFLEKSARMEVFVESFALHREAAADHVSVLDCDADVLACLDDAVGRGSDSPSCGSAARVRACLSFVEERVLSGPRQFVDDLLEEVEEYYRIFSDAIEARGGRSLAGARENIHLREVRLVDDLDPSVRGPYPSSYYDVYRHPDMIYPESSMVWYGVYDGAHNLVDLYAVNAPDPE